MCYDKFTLEQYTAFDYFTRYTNADRSFLEDICRKAFGYCVEGKNNYSINFLSVNKSHYVSLDVNSLGVYAEDENNLNNIHSNGIVYLEDLTEDIYKGGSNIFYLLLYKFGLKDYSSIFELFRRLNVSYNNSSRYMFHQRAISFNHLPIRFINPWLPSGNELFDIDQLNDCNNLITYSFEGAHFPFYFGATSYKIYWYKTENGDVTFGVIYYFDDQNNILIKLPISQWDVRPTQLPHYIPARDRQNSTKFDLLHPAPPYILYNQDIIKNTYNDSTTIFIAPNEFYVPGIEYILNGRIDQYQIVTTWSGGCTDTINNTDWNYLKEKNVSIAVTNMKGDDCNTSIQNAYTIYKKLKHIGINFKGFVITSNNTDESKPIVYNSIDEFIQLAYSQHNICLETRYINYALTLKDLKSLEMEPDEYLFDGLIRLGEQIMLFGARGACKSYLSNLFAISLASGIPILNNKFCPTRAFKVLYIDGEMNIKLIKERTLAIQKGLDIDSELCNSNLNILSSTYLGEDFNFSNDQQLRKFKRDIAEAEIIFLDSVNFIFPEAMGNDATSCKNLNDFILENRSNNKTVFTIDHASTKTGNTKNIKDSFGSSAKSFSMDIILSITKKGKIFQVSSTKSRSYPEEYFNFQFSFDAMNDKVSFQLKNSANTPISESDDAFLNKDQFFVLCCIAKSIINVKNILNVKEQCNLDTLSLARTKIFEILKKLENCAYISHIKRGEWAITDKGNTILNKLKEKYEEIYEKINSLR